MLRHFSEVQKISFDIIRAEYLQCRKPWIIGYSGGKDSSALVKLVFNVLRTIKDFSVPITIVYCDTAVEIPVIRTYVWQVLTSLSLEIKEANLPIKIKIAIPELKDRYFVKVIGRGYPTPTNKFRWCTDRLRINPVQKIVKELSKDGSLILLGVRKGESLERDRIIVKHSSDSEYFLSQSNYPNSKIFSPIINYSVNDVWD